jgi:PAS domain-containing protein
MPSAETANLLVVGLVVVFLLAFAEFRRRVGVLRRQAAAAQGALAARDDILATAPAGYCGWTRDGAWVTSASLGPLMGVDGTFAGFDDLAARFDAASRPALAQAAERLRRSGQPVALSMRLGPRVFDVIGRRSGGDSKEGGKDAGTATAMLWFYDVTLREQLAARAHAAQGAAEAKTGLFTQIFNAVAMPVWLRDSDGRLVACNNAYAIAVEAASPGAAIGDQRELAGARLEWSQNLAARAVALGSPQSGDLHVVIDGTRHLFSITEAPIGDGYLAGFAVNRTELEDIHAELTRHMAAHRDVLEKLGTGIVIYGPDTRVRFFNSAFARLWGLEEDWLATLPTNGEILEELRVRRRLPEQADFQAYKKQRLALYTSLIEPLEELLYLPDERVLRSVVNPHPQGGLLYTTEDVTDRLTLERSYNTLIAVQRETLDNLHAAVAVFGSDGKLKLYNQAYARIWNFQSALLSVEPHVSDLVEYAKDLFRYSGDWATYRDYVVNRATDHVARSGVFLRSDGSVLDYTSVPLPDGAMMFSYLDVTDSYNVERALRERNEALETADRL